MKDRKTRSKMFQRIDLDLLKYRQQGIDCISPDTPRLTVHENDSLNCLAVDITVLFTVPFLETSCLTVFLLKSIKVKLHFNRLNFLFEVPNETQREKSKQTLPA